MDLTLSDEEREIREWVRTFVSKELMPLEPKVLERERQGERGFSLEELRGLQEKAKQSGFFGVLTPEEYGGMGLGSVMAALIEIELGNMRNAADAKRMTSAKGRATYARGLADAVRTYLR